MKDLIFELPNFLPDELCDHLINKFDSDPRKIDGVINLYGKKIVNKELKNSTELFFSGVENWKQENEVVQRYVRRFVKKYLKWLDTEFSEYNKVIPLFGRLSNSRTCDMGYSIQKQPSTASYAWHYDGSPGCTGDFLLMIAYLSTPEKGGETEFIYNNRKVKPERGKVIAFPASWTYPHRGNQVISGNKYILTSVIKFDVED